MPRRWLDSSFFNDEKVGRLPIAERQLFAAMIANQDDDGRLKGHPAYLRSIAFPYDEISIDEVKQMRDHIAEVNPNVIVYPNAGEEYIQLKRHKRYQKPRYYHPSKLPAPPGWPFEEKENPSAPTSNHSVTKEPPDTNHAATKELPSSNQAVTKQYTEDGVGRGKGLDLDLGKGKGVLSQKEPRTSTAEVQGSKQKAHQQEAGLFLDKVAKHEKVDLLNREKLIHLVRTKLFKVSGTTVEKLFEFYCWLKENDPFFRNKAPPQVIGGMPDRYPSWLAGKLEPQKKGAAGERAKGSRPASDYRGKW